MDKYTKKFLATPSDVYDEVLYKGLEGLVMKTGHRLLEHFSRPANIILEIGPGSQPQFKWIKYEFDVYIVLDTINQLDKLDQIKFPLKSTLIKIPIEQQENILISYKNKAEKDLMWSRQHINAVQRLMAIFNAYFIRKRIIYFPTLIHSINLNLLCIIKLDKQDFNNK